MIHSFENEKQYAPRVLGIDEVGRGSIAGSLVVAGIIVDESIAYIGVNDSKKLSKKRREEIFDILTATYQYFISIIPPQVIDEINIHNATLAGIAEVIQDANTNIPALIDGKFTPKINHPMFPIIGGDSKYASIAAASIIAKVTRDRMMSELHEEFPFYNWKQNVGYGTKEHYQAINDNGITEHHRKSFLRC